MKRTALTFCLFASMIISPVLAQTGGGGGAAGGASAGGAAAGAGATGKAGGAAVGGGASAGANVAVPPVREPLPPTFNGQTAPNQGANVPGTGVGAQGNGSINPGNNGAGANANTSLNAGGTNSPNTSGTNQLTPASRSDSATNRIYWTNRFNTNMANTNAASTTNRFGLGPQDVATTTFDRTLIIRMRATIIQRLGGTPAAWAPVIFNSDNGAVTVEGAVPSVVIKQRVIAMLQTFPGVVRVTDQLQVDANMGADGNATVGTTTTGNVRPGPTGGWPVTRTTNRDALMPTGRVPSGPNQAVTNSTPATTP